MDENCALCTSVKRWLKKPFNENGSVIDWFLFIGLVGIISFFWTRILARILK